MTCHALQEAIVEVARGRDVGRGTAAAVETHVEHCQACAAMLARERALTQGLRELAVATAGELPSPLLERQLRRVFVERAQGSRARWWMPVAAAAAAVFAAVVWWQGTRPTPAPPGVDERHVARGSVPAPEQVQPATTPRDDPKQVEGAVSSKASASSKPRSATKPATADSGFVALPAAIGLPDFESGVIVRMEMPVAALPSYGLEVVSDSKAPVEADLLIGQDGQARAIRLVNRVTTRSGADQ